LKPAAWGLTAATHEGSEPPMTETTKATRQARAARNQSLYRLVNERIEKLNESLDFVLPLGQWVCECANECSDLIEMT
jgi:hypothetical protein